MINIYVIRHGCVDAQPMPDPALNHEGRQQALRSAEQCMALTHAVPVFTSPLLRCQQSAEVLAAAWDVDYQLEWRVTEVPSPMDEPAARSDWLRRMLGLTWPQMQAQASQMQNDYSLGVRYSTLPFAAISTSTM